MYFVLSPHGVPPNLGLVPCPLSSAVPAWCHQTQGLHLVFFLWLCPRGATKLGACTCFLSRLSPRDATKASGLYLDLLPRLCPRGATKRRGCTFASLLFRGATKLRACTSSSFLGCPDVVLPNLGPVRCSLSWSVSARNLKPVPRPFSSVVPSVCVWRHQT